MLLWSLSPPASIGTDGHCLFFLASVYFQNDYCTVHTIRERRHCERSQAVTMEQEMTCRDPWWPQRESFNLRLTFIFVLGSNYSRDRFARCGDGMICGVKGMLRKVPSELKKVQMSIVFISMFKWVLIWSLSPDCQIFKGFQCDFLCKHALFWPTNATAPW